MPGIHVQLDGILNLSAFAVRLERHELPTIVDRLRAIPPAQIASMQAELRKVWERFTYSALFKREYTMQAEAERLSQAAHSTGSQLRARVGMPPQPGDQKSHVFRKLEGRLRGLDAADALITHLRHKLTDAGGCIRQPAAAAAAVLPSSGLAQPVPLVSHGQPAEVYPPVDEYVWTSGVV